jgi:hypothetical protein
VHFLIHLLIYVVAALGKGDEPDPVLQFPRRPRTREESLLWDARRRERRAARAWTVAAAVGHFGLLIAVCAVLAGQPRSRAPAPGWHEGFRVAATGLVLVLGMLAGALFARSRGRDRTWGALGLLSLVGLLSLGLLRRRCGDCGRLTGPGPIRCEGCLAPI